MLLNEEKLTNIIKNVFEGITIKEHTFPGDIQDYEGQDISYENVKDGSYNVILRMSDNGEVFDWKDVAKAMGYDLDSFNETDVETLHDAIEDSMAEVFDDEELTESINEEKEDNSELSFYDFVDILDECGFVITNFQDVMTKDNKNATRYTLAPKHGKCNSEELKKKLSEKFGDLISFGKASYRYAPEISYLTAIIIEPDEYVLGECDKQLNESSETYTMNKWSEDKVLNLKDGQEVSEEVVNELINSVPPAFYKYGIFQNGESVGVEKDTYIDLYQTFIHDGSDNNWRYIGLCRRGETKPREKFIYGEK